MPRVSQHVFLRDNIQIGESSFTQKINIPFEANKLIIHYVLYSSTSSEGYTTLIRCNQLGGYLTSFGESGMTPRSEFILPNPQMLNGDYLFEYFRVSGVVENTREGTLVIDLEFVKE